MRGACARTDEVALFHAAATHRRGDIQYSCLRCAAWTRATSPAILRAMRAKKVEKLSDEFGQYAITLNCQRCRHARTVYPNALAPIVGWEAPLAAIASRMRCSKCNAKQCELTVTFPVKPRGSPVR